MHPGVWIKVARCDVCGLVAVTWRKTIHGHAERYCIACISDRGSGAHTRAAAA